MTSMIAGVPEPRVHDEFSYLLAADTYARGRAATRPHPFWEHFESFHVIQQPTYASKYPPAQGLLLAVGDRLGGHPIVGVWIGAALMCAAILWMLQAWLPPRWALVGGLFTALQLGIVGYWAQSYWGGAVAATGGALVFGALRRLIRAPTVGSSVAMGAGVLLLAASRPFEGLVVCLIAAVCLLQGGGFARNRKWVSRVLAPGLITTVAGFALLGGLNSSVTGDSLTLPYTVHTEQYSVAPFFVWQTPRPMPTYRHSRLEEFHSGWELDKYRALRSVRGWAEITLGRVGYLLYAFMFGPVSMPRVPGIQFIPLLLIPHVLRRRWAKFAVATIALLMVALAGATYFEPHYFAPVVGLGAYLLVLGIRYLVAMLRRSRPISRWAVPAMIVYCSGLAGFGIARSRQVEGDPTAWFNRRSAIQDSLTQGGGRHLILVDYEQGYSVHHEWVYNSAEIDQQPVVWARAMDEARNARLLAYYSDRQAWQLVLRSGTEHVPMLTRLGSLADAAAGPPSR
jgi:hypothetical protein